MKRYVIRNTWTAQIGLPLGPGLQRPAVAMPGQALEVPEAFYRFLLHHAPTHLLISAGKLELEEVCIIDLPDEPACDMAPVALAPVATPSTATDPNGGMDAGPPIPQPSTPPCEPEAPPYTVGDLVRMPIKALAPLIHEIADVELLGDLAIIDERKTIKAMVAARLEGLR